MYAAVITTDRDHSVQMITFKKGDLPVDQVSTNSQSHRGLISILCLIQVAPKRPIII